MCNRWSASWVFGCCSCFKKRFHINLNPDIFTLFPSSSCQPFSWVILHDACSVRLLCNAIHPPLTPFTTFMSLRSPSSPPSRLWWVLFLIQSLLGFCCHWSLNTKYNDSFFISINHVKSFQMFFPYWNSVWGTNINEDNNIQPAVYVRVHTLT